MEKDYLFAKAIARWFPTRLLPTGHKLLNGERVTLSVQDRRERLQRGLNARAIRLLNQVSPRRRWRKHTKPKLQSANLRAIHEKVGEIALLHFAIEAGMRETLLKDWNVPRIITKETISDCPCRQIKSKRMEIDRLHGQYLRKQFLRELRERELPTKFIKEYKALDKKFKDLSERRNSIVKASYVINHAHIGTYKPITTEEWMRKVETYLPSDDAISDLWKLSGVTPFTIENADKLLNDLRKLHAQYLELKWEICKDKRMLLSQNTTEGEEFPASAMSNPYLHFGVDS